MSVRPSVPLSISSLPPLAVAIFFIRRSKNRALPLHGRPFQYFDDAHAECTFTKSLAASSRKKDYPSLDRRHQLDFPKLRLITESNQARGEEREADRRSRILLIVFCMISSSRHSHFFCLVVPCTYVVRSSI